MLFPTLPTMLNEGDNLGDGIAVVVTRRRARRYNIRVHADGTVSLTVPRTGGTLHEATTFLESQWGWVLRARERALAREAVRPPEADPMPLDVLMLQALLDSLMSQWTRRLGEAGVTWKLRRMKTRWGVCNYVKRQITFAEMLAEKPRDQVEYVVVHELTHLKAHGHGPAFWALLGAQLPDWEERRRALNGKQ